MHDVDFLPAEYRQQDLRRRHRSWRMVILAGFAALLVASALVQHRARRTAENELAAIAPEHEAALAQTKRLGQWQAQLQEARACADLFTYLRHPWPRSQIVDALLVPLPQEVTFRQLRIDRQSLVRQAAAELAPRLEPKAEKEQQAKQPPPVRDLKRFRDECDPKETVVTISGLTSESAALHRYLGELGKAGLFSKVDLDVIETDSQDPKGQVLQFSARLLVRPGYGQPGGPTTIVVRDLAKAARHSQPTTPQLP